MENNWVQRPSALLAVCTLTPQTVVPELPSFATAPTAHEMVGYGAVAVGAVKGATQAPQQTRVRGTSGFAANQSVIDMDSVVGVRGKPPRGRPV